MATMITEQPMIFLGLRQMTSSKGNLLNIVTLACPVKFENFDFFVNLDKIQLDPVANNSPVTARFELSKYNNNNDLRLVAVTAVQEKAAVK